jgi:hypothetical protein
VVLVECCWVQQHTSGGGHQLSMGESMDRTTPTYVGGWGRMRTQLSDSRWGCSGRRVQGGSLSPPSSSSSCQIVCQCVCILEKEED